MADQAKSLLSESETASRAIWCAKGVHVWREGTHLAVKGPGTPPVYISGEDLARVAMLIALPPKPEPCAHGRPRGECAACGTVAGPAV